MARPALSICVPSRNRQRYLADLIAWFAARPRQDVEFVIADNSDDPSIMNDVMAQYRPDRRFRYLPSAPRPLSMIDNWERTVAAATGEWVSAIGDDDVLDPDVIDAIDLALALKPGMDAFTWSGVNWDWPRPDKPPANVLVPMGASLHDMPQSMLMARALGWVDSTDKVACGFSLYHSAISSRLIERIRSRFGGKLFTHPTVDYDSAFKIIGFGQGFVLSIRPFSIFGACPESNTVTAHHRERMRTAFATFISEHGHDIDAAPWMADFPFPASLGLTASIANVQAQFRHMTGTDLPGWEPLFAKACARNCGNFADRADFDLVVAGYSEAFRRWQGGRWLSDFRPVFAERPTGQPFTGFHEGQLFLGDGIGNAKSCTAFYDILNAMLVPASELAGELRSAGLENIVLARLDQSPAMPRSSASSAFR